MTLSSGNPALAGLLSDMIDGELRRCGVYAEKREDLRQEILIWFLTVSREFRIVGPALVSAVVKRFLRPHSRFRRDGAGQVPLTEDIQAVGSGPGYGFEVVEKLEGTLRHLGTLLADGYSWNEACRAADIKPGSRSYFRRRLREELKLPSKSAVVPFRG